MVVIATIIPIPAKRDKVGPAAEMPGRTWFRSFVGASPDKLCRLDGRQSLAIWFP